MSDNTARHIYGQLRERISGAAMILHAAEANDLPAPRIVGALYANREPVDFHLASYDDLVAWATWVEEPIGVNPNADHQHQVHGSMFEQPFELVYIDMANAHPAVSA